MSLKRWIGVAVLFSLLLHLGLVVWFQGVHVGELAIPSFRERVTRPFEAKRVEIPEQLIEPSREQIAPIPNTVRTQQPPVQMPEPGRVLEQVLQANPPRAFLPEITPGNAPEFAPQALTPPTKLSPYLPQDSAKIQAEISRFSVGPVTPGIPGANLVLPSGVGTNITIGAAATGQGGLKALGEGSLLPGLDQIKAQFRLSAPIIDPNIPEPVIVRLPSDILFDFDSSRLRVTAEPTLQQLVELMKKYPHANVEIQGHTDSFGEDDYNLKLSLARAQAVQTWLSTRLSEADYSLVARGFGKTRPVVSPQGTIEQQERNRRVEIVIRALK